MALSWPFKDPDEVLDYELDWSAQMTEDSDTISTSAWEVPTGLTMDSESNTTTSATVWLSGGAVGETYALVNEIVTAGGRTWNQTVKIKIKER